MLSITHAARVHIAELLADAGAHEVLRLSSGPDAVQITTDRVRIGDKTFYEGGRCILAIDQMLLRTISGQILDVEIVDGQPALLLRSE